MEQQVLFFYVVEDTSVGILKQVEIVFLLSATRHRFQSEKE